MELPLREPSQRTAINPHGVVSLPGNEYWALYKGLQEAQARYESSVTLYEAALREAQAENERLREAVNAALSNAAQWWEKAEAALSPPADEAKHGD